MPLIKPSQEANRQKFLPSTFPTGSSCWPVLASVSSIFLSQLMAMENTQSSKLNKFVWDETPLAESELRVLSPFNTCH